VRLVLVHARAQFLEILRYPAASVPTVAFPVLFFMLFGVPNASRHANVLLAGFAGFAVLGVAFFQFGVGIAIDRTSAWERFLRTLPVTPSTRFAARLLVALVYAAAAVLAVVAAAVVTTDVHFAAGAWGAFLAVLFLGAVPFVLLGIGIGYWARPKAALPIANVLYLLLAYLGGLWTAPGDLPTVVSEVSPYLPTRTWGDLLDAAALGLPLGTGPMLVLVAWTAGLGAIAWLGYRRDEGQSFA
jgi:ABC-2 type transport system permease protein